MGEKQGCSWGPLQHASLDQFIIFYQYKLVTTITVTTMPQQSQSGRFQASQWRTAGFTCVHSLTSAGLRLWAMLSCRESWQRERLVSYVTESPFERWRFDKEKAAVIPRWAGSERLQHVVWWVMREQVSVTVYYKQKPPCPSDGVLTAAGAGIHQTLLSHLLTPDQSHSSKKMMIMISAMIINWEMILPNEREHLLYSWKLVIKVIKPSEISFFWQQTSVK